MSAWLELKVGARLAAVRVLNDLLDVALRSLELGDDLRHDVTLGVAELVANVCEHEYAGRDGDVGVRLDVTHDEVRVTVLSHGRAFDLEGALVRARSRDPLETDGGRGLVLLEGLFDEVRLERDADQNRITLRKARP
jgi:anti-sigma regulatory factor (Ser/Thr protein kinase)